MKSIAQAYPALIYPALICLAQFFSFVVAPYLVALLFACYPALAQAAPAFTLSRIDSADASYQETLLITDIDGDGDQDFFTGEGFGSKNWWFENLAGNFHRRHMNDSNAADVGAVLLDINTDGKIDKASSGFWFRNPGFAPRIPELDTILPLFHACRYSELGFSHDVVSADFNGDKRPDLLTIHYDGIRWYRAPPPDSACGLWPVFQINGFTEDAQHGGLAAGDFDGDGDIDVSRLDRWFENADGKGETWIEHINIPFVTPKPGGWGLSGRALAGDMNGDGHIDLVQTECDLISGRVAWVENVGGRGQNWKLHLIKDTTDGQDFHSLLWADFDGDGDLDLLLKGFRWNQHYMLENQLRSLSLRPQSKMSFKAKPLVLPGRSPLPSPLHPRNIQGRYLRHR